MDSSLLLYEIRDSPIQGKGVFATQTIPPNTNLGHGITFRFYLLPQVTKNLGKWINHSFTKANLELQDLKDGQWSLVTTQTIPKDDEILMDYRKTPWYILKPLPEWDDK